MVVVFVMTCASQGSAQEDSQTSGSSSSPSATGPGMSVNTTPVQKDTNASAEASASIQDRVTVGSFGDDRITGSNETEVIIGQLGAILFAPIVVMTISREMRTWTNFMVERVMICSREEQQQISCTEE